MLKSELEQREIQLAADVSKGQKLTSYTTVYSHVSILELWNIAPIYSRASNDAAMWVGY